MRIRKLKGLAVTLLLMAGLTIIFIVDTLFLAPEGGELFSLEHFVWGDKSGALTRTLMLSTEKVYHWQLWRLMTSMILHAGILHLVCNLLVFLTVGFVLEPRIGHWKFLAVFLCGGLLSALCMVFIFNIEAGLGASPAISAAFGAFAVLLIKDFKNLKKEIKWFQWVFLAVSVVFYIYGDGTAVTRFEHLTGFLGGIVLGIIFIVLPAKNEKAETESL